MTLRLAFVGDGSSDRVLIPLLETLIRRECPTVSFEIVPAGWLPKKDPIGALVRAGVWDALVYHRDAEREEPSQRLREITQRVAGRIPTVPVIPVRMTEAWLLVDERAIRTASGNPNGTVRLRIPPVQRLESLPDPKADLENLLLEASELRGRRRARLIFSEMRRIVARNITEIDRLYELDSVRAFCKAAGDILPTLGGHPMR